MQLRKLSLIACALIVTTQVQAQDYVNFEVLQYNENDSRVSVTAPSIEINKDFGTDYTLNVDFVIDDVSGASPTYYDAASGASAYSVGTSTDIKYGNIEFTEQRTAVSANFTTRFANRDELVVGGSRSQEHDFYSSEASASYLHYLDDSHNQSIGFGGSFAMNEVLDRPDTLSGASHKETNDGFNLQLAFSQVIDETSVLSIGGFYGSESGFLSSPYHNIVRNGVVRDEVKPDSRVNYGLKLAYQKALSDSFFAQANYKYYTDDWDIDSHTLDTKFYYEATSSLTLGFGLRYYTQSEANFYGDSFTNEEFASSDERVEAFDAITYKLDVEYKFTEDLSYNLGANFYDQSTGLQATFFTTGIKYAF
jgi:hypothetical protein